MNSVTHNELLHILQKFAQLKGNGSFLRIMKHQKHMKPGLIEHTELQGVLYSQKEYLFLSCKNKKYKVQDMEQK